MLLVLDTSAAVSVAIVRDGEVLAAAHRYDPRRHAELLTPMITEVVEEAGTRLAEVTCVVAGQGPGPFTGLRVALVTGRVLAATLGVPLHGVTSLDGLAYGALSRLPGAASAGELLVATDARRREVYWARYRPTAAASSPARWQGWDRITGPAVGKATEVAAAAEPGALAIGRGCLLYPAALSAAGDLSELGLLDPSAADLGLLAEQELAADGPRDPVPLYLRRPDATEPAQPAGAR